MQVYQILKAAALEVYATECKVAQDNYNKRAIALANYNRALGEALKAI
jgi:hypothetical protein